MQAYNFSRQIALGSEVDVDLGNVQQPRYGRFLEEFIPGTTFQHPRGLTLYPAFVQEFATTFMQANPLYLDETYARAHGFAGLPVSPLMVLNVVLSLGVQNNSEQAIAHLGYYDVAFPLPVLAGDTLHAESLVLSRRVRGTKPGIVRVRTHGRNQRGEVVVRYERAILIPAKDPAALADQQDIDAIKENSPAPLSLSLSHMTPRPLPAHATGSHTYFEDFAIGEIILHSNGRTVTNEHMAWSYRLGNTHPLHYDQRYSSQRSGPMSGAPIVYGGLVFAWLEGLASRDTSENALWDLGYTEGYHTQPTIAGDTLYAVSRVLAKADGPAGSGIVTLQLIGVKNETGATAVSQYGAALFEKETGKDRNGRIPYKIFEIERRLLVKKRKAWLTANFR